MATNGAISTPHDVGSIVLPLAIPRPSSMVDLNESALATSACAAHWLCILRSIIRACPAMAQTPFAQDFANTILTSKSQGFAAAATRSI